MSNLKLTIDQLGNSSYWHDNLIGEMSTYYIINALNYIARQADDYKMQYELYLMESPDWPMKTSAKDIADIVEMDTQEWIRNTPIWKAFVEELSQRNMLDYAKIKVNIL